MGPGGGGGVGVTQVYVLVTQAAEVLRPTANGTYTEWGELFGAGTTHWDHVEEVTADDGASYIMDNTWNGTERDTFQLSDTNYTSIGWVEVVARAARITTNDNNNVRLFLRSGSADAQSPVQTLSMSWTDVSYTWTTDPATGQPWTQSAVNALQAGIQNAMGPSGGGGVEVTQVYVVVSGTPQPYTYPYPSIGADNASQGTGNDDGHYGVPYSRWSAAGAAAGFVIQAPGNGPYRQIQVNLEAADAASAYEVGVPVYVYFCIYPMGSANQTTADDVKAFADSLRDAGVFGYINTHQDYLAVAYDIEDGSDACGPYVYINLSDQEAAITYISQLVINDARADGLGSDRPVAFSSTPGITYYQYSGTVALTGWIANSFPAQFQSTGTYFPQLFGSHVRPSNWATTSADIIQTFANNGLAYYQTNPNWEDYHGLGACDSQSDINTMKAWYDYVAAGGVVNDYTWYVSKEPFCVQ